MRSGTSLVRPLILIKFVLAVCGLVYELLLAQTLSAFFANTILRYSVTVGLYLFCMGLGAFAAGRKSTVSPLLRLWGIEAALTLAGSLSVLSLFVLSAVGIPDFGLLVWAHGLIAVIGFLTGLELPLIIGAVEHNGEDARHGILAADYLGAFVGSLVFVFWLYPSLGLILSVWVTAALNAVAALILAVFIPGVFKSKRQRFLLTGISAFLVIYALAGCLSAQIIEAWCLMIYLK